MSSQAAAAALQGGKETPARPVRPGPALLGKGLPGCPGRPSDGLVLRGLSVALPLLTPLFL